MCYYYDEDLKFFKDGDEIMKEVIVSAGLVYLYLNGYLENERLHIQSIDTYSCLENGFYQRVIEASTIANEVDEIVHIFAVVGVKEKANQIYSMIEKRLKNNFNNIIAGKNIKKSSKMLDKTGNVFFRCVQEFFCEQLDHFPKQVNYDFNDFTIKGICSSRLPDYVGDSITNEIIYIWLEREKPMLCGRQLMIRSFFVRDFIGRKVIASLPNKENESWRFIFEGGHQISMNEKFSYLKETLHPDDLGGFCSSNIQSILMNPIYAYGQWFQPNDVCEEWHKVFLYLCAISDNEWNEVSISKIYDKFLDFLRKNICITMEAPSLISKSEYYKILLIHIINFRSFLKGEDEPVLSKDLLQTMNSRYVYLPYLWELIPPNTYKNRFSANNFKKQINEAMKENDSYIKGILWENAIAYVLNNIEGLKITGRRIRTCNQEIDISLVNISLDDQLWQLGAYILVECKNWSSRVGVHQIRNIAHISNLKGNRTAILFASNGITSDAQREIYRLAIEGCFIVCVTVDDLLQMTSAKECKILILDKWNLLQENVELTTIL